MSRNTATIIGLSAILMWASLVGLIKYVSSVIGSSLAVTLIYSISALLVFMFFRFPNFKLISKQYLLWASILFAAYELCFAFSIALSTTSEQAIEVSIINYLWPCFTILAFVIFKELQFNALIIVGVLISLSGVVFIQSGNGTLSIENVMANFLMNPVSYFLAFLGAIIWSFYCVVTKKMSNGHNPISILFISVAVMLWIKLFMTHPFNLASDLALFDWSILIYLLLASTAMGFGYAAWNIGIIHGNIAVIVIASYFAPVFSSVLAMFILQTQLSVTFWQGTAMVTLGSLICYISTNWHAIKLLSRKMRDLPNLK